MGRVQLRASIFGIALCFLLSGLVTVALALPSGRSIPAAERPFVVEQVFSVPDGELHLTRALQDQKELRLLLQANSGLVCELTHVEGGDHCMRSLLNTSSFKEKSKGCSFAFLNTDAGCDFAVKSEELVVSDLFESNKRTLERQREQRNL